MRGIEVFDEFVDDYFAECDEHLAAIRRILLAVESRDPATIEGGELQEFARRLHTLKGLSGMVGLASAEDLAHALEDVLRGSVSERTPLNADTVDCLFAGTALLDACIQTKRTGQAPPDLREFMARAQYLMQPARTAETETSHALVPQGTAVATRQPGREELFDFEFTPSPEQAARGVGVELIRQRLLKLGEIVRTTPRAQPGGSVSFEFVVRVPPGVTPPPEWSADGLTWKAESPTPSAPQGSRAGDGVGAAATSIVRVELSRVDDLMRLIGEMVVLRSRLDDSLRQSNGHTLDDLRETNIALERQLRSLREGVMRIRLVPIGEVFDRMRFAMRDVIRETGKSVRLEFSGGDTQIDKLIVDRMLEPLMHLVRNAAAHGIEHRELRVARGKPAEGRIALHARAAGDRIVLETQDDGAGVDVEDVRLRARATGLVQHDRPLGDEELLDVICAQGFSTRDVADRASGRGVGMGVVRATIRALGGELAMHSVVGQGTRFTIELPLTLMIADALLVRVGNQTMAIPQLTLREILQLDPSTVTSLENSQVISYRGTVLPLLTLHRIFRLAPPADARPHVLVVGSDTQMTGLVVDGLVGLREIVVHPVSDPLVAVPGIGAATELSDGRIALIIDVAALLRRARESSARLRAAAAANARFAGSVQ